MFQALPDFVWDSELHDRCASSVFIAASLVAIPLGGTIRHYGGDSLIMSDVITDIHDGRSFMSPVSSIGS